MSVYFEKVTVIGVGLIGGSVARSLKKNKLCGRITGCSRREEELQKGVELGVIDDYNLSMAEAAKDANLIIISVPLGVFEKVFAEIKDVISDNTLITDVGSAKGSVIRSASLVFDELPPGLVPGHPIAGNEKSGVEASFDSLFENRCTIITPTEKSSQSAIDGIQQMWESIGAKVVSMTPEHHDLVLAATSHLPHVLAYSLVDTLGQMHEHSEIFQFAAGGFRDFTRIASSDPVMWRDICLHNKDAILTVLKSYERQLKCIENAINDQNSTEIEKIFLRAKKARDEHVIL